VRVQDDEINTRFHGVADDFFGTIAKADLFAARHMHFTKLSAKAGEMIPRGRFDAVVKVTLFLDLRTSDDLHDM
jgi:hypothetical protein